MPMDSQRSSPPADEGGTPRCTPGIRPTRGGAAPPTVGGMNELQTGGIERDTGDLIGEIERYLAAVAMFREEGCEPEWIAESLNVLVRRVTMSRESVRRS